MIDIHSHFLPGLDDGAKTMADAVAMLEAAAADGTTCIVGTPHSNYEYEFSVSRNLELAAELQAKMGDRIRLMTGCDFHLSYENLEQVREDPSRFTVNQGRYLLTEFATHHIPPGIENQFHQLRLMKLIPVITHPERIPALIEERFDLLIKLVSMGCPVQITGGAITGRFGELAQGTCRTLIESGFAHFVASDAHDTVNRHPGLSGPRAVVAEEYGEEVAEALFVSNPLAAVESRPLPYWPEQPAPKPRRRFWFL